MFNLIVSGNGDWWEEAPFTSSVERFKEYSGLEGNLTDIAQAIASKQLEEIPTLLMYEVGASGIHTRWVRHGRIINLARKGKELIFDFMPDPQAAYIERSALLGLSASLRIEPFEQHRTHWAIKDGDLPQLLLQTAQPERPERTLAEVTSEYVDAKRGGHWSEIRNLEKELKEFQKSVEMAKRLLPAWLAIQSIPEIYPLLGVEPRSPEGRNALEAILLRDQNKNDLPSYWNYSLAWFLGQYGTVTESLTRKRALEECRAHLIGLRLEGANEPITTIEDVGFALWCASRSPLLATHLRREIAVVTDHLVRRQSPEGFWITSDAELAADVRGTAFAIVALQRLGDDRHHDQIRAAVTWLILQRHASEGTFPRKLDEIEPDVIATTLAMEAVRRSDLADEVPHVLAEGDAWLVAAQETPGRWIAEPFQIDFVTSMVLDYLIRRQSILAQVDGFLLMSRGFFRKAEEFLFEGGANNRRLAAIAAVHAFEMFLYGIFERRDDLALSAFRENGTETLGPREALRALQDGLKRVGILDTAKKLKFRDELSSLTSRRDGIIHRAQEISVTELEAGLKHVRGFITYYGESLLDLHLLQ